MSTSKEKGDRFEAEVADALELAGYRVTSEQLAGHARVDLLARSIRFGREWVTAVECKFESRPLPRARVNAIWQDWEPLVERGVVHEVLIVAASGLAPSAMAFAEAKRGLEAQRLEQLLADSIRFDSYLGALEDEYGYSADGLPEYYVPPVDTDGNDLEDLVVDWIAGERLDAPFADQPLAILGAYGMGKSSFATHIAARLARERAADLTARVPILVRMQELTGEQSLEGLLGKHFTATHDAPGYSFAKLMKLNRAGRLVMILDGFDEMRQLLTWREFQHNLREINRLTAGDSRVIILGRPTAFETDEQLRLGLHGETPSVGGAVRRETGWPDYHEIHLAPLNDSQCKQFLASYLSYVRGRPVDNEELDGLWYRINSRALRDIARRPVQLRMLSEILPVYAGDTEQLDVVAVYDLFVDELIDRVIRREEEKQSRLAFSSEERRLFLRRLAYWLWTSQAAEPITTDALPDDLIRPLAGSRDLEAARRDLVVASPLDRRTGERIRFPHRSFQEFLVAEELWERIRQRLAANDGLSAPRRAEEIVTEADRAISREVADFMSLLRSEADEDAARKLIVAFEGAMSLRLADALFVTQRVVDQVMRRVNEKGDTASFRPWELLTLALWQKRESGVGKASLIFDSFAAAKPDPEGNLLALFCIMLSGERTPHATRAALTMLHRLVTGGRRVERIKRRSYSEPRSQRQPELGNLAANHRLAPPQPWELKPERGQRGRRRPAERPLQALPLALEDRNMRPVGKDFVLATRDGASPMVRLGVCVGRTRLVDIGGRYGLTSGPDLQVRWTEDWVPDLLARVQFGPQGRWLDLSRAHPIFARVLARVAFTSEWMSTIRLGGRLDVLDRLDLTGKAPGWLPELQTVAEEIKVRMPKLTDQPQLEMLPASEL